MGSSNAPLRQPTHACSLTDAFSAVVQFLLAGLAFSSLIYKYTTERPQRPLKVWQLDTLKLAIGGGTSHFLNLVFALAFEDDNTNPCVWYFLGCFMDSTVGVLLCYLFMECFERMGTGSGIHVRGSYGDPPCLTRWGVQVFFWVVIVICSKISVTIALYVDEGWWTRAGQFILAPVSFNPKVELVTAMLIAPFLCMVFSFWIIDSFLKGVDWKVWASGYSKVGTSEILDDSEPEDEDVYVNPNASALDEDVYVNPNASAL